MNNKPDNASNPEPSLRMRLFRLTLVALVVSLGLIGLGLIGWVALPWVVFPIFVEPRAHELGRVASWSGDIISAVTFIAVCLSVFCFRLLFTRNRRQHWSAVAALLGLAVLYFGLHAWFTRDNLYDKNGSPVFYWGVTPQGTILKQCEPGMNPYTKKPLLPASAEYLTLIRARLREPLVQVDPATRDWFDVNTGWPMLWYYRGTDGQCDFYARPAIHPRYQAELQPVTVEFRRQWEEVQAEQKTKAAALAHQEEEKRQAETAQRAAEQQHELEADRAKAETLRREEQARAEAQKAREQALQAESEQQEKAAAQARRQQMILDRRVREAAASITELELLEPAAMVAHICPDLRADSYQPQMFRDDFAGRRFRYNCRVTRLLTDSRIALLETVSVGDIHLVIQAHLQPETFERLRAIHDVVLAGTVADIRFIPGITNINGIPGQMCILDLGNVTGHYREPGTSSVNNSVPSAGKGEPFFVPASSFRNDPPVAAAVSYTVQNGVRLILAPLRLICGNDQSRPLLSVNIQSVPAPPYVPAQYNYSGQQVAYAPTRAYVPPQYSQQRVSYTRQPVRFVQPVFVRSGSTPCSPASGQNRPSPSRRSH